MQRINKEHYGRVYELYKKSNSFFPLIASVLLDKQNGHVYVDDALDPEVAYIEHAFGFAQIVGNLSCDFENGLKNHLLIKKQFQGEKARIYGISSPNLFKPDELGVLHSIRQRFHLDDSLSEPLHSNEIVLREVDLDTISLVHDKFDLVDRFWRNSEDFIEHAHAVLAFYKGEPASLCYAAAVAENQAEIDIVTLPEFRSLGLGKITAQAFIKRCDQLSIQPLWDCFTNNAGSMALSRSLGFRPSTPPYPFYTIG